MTYMKRLNWHVLMLNKANVLTILLTFFGLLTINAVKDENFSNSFIIFGSVFLITVFLYLFVKLTEGD